MKEEAAATIYNLLYEIAQLDSKFIVLAILMVCAVIVLDCVTTVASEKHKKAGLKSGATTAGIDGGRNLPVRSYVSDIQGLAGTPDALINEDGYIIPIERKPLAKKIHDRYVAQLLVYMRLVEEFEGKKPPYGYLILGPNCRSFKIENTEERQAWLQKIIDEMRGILAGAEAVPTPHPRKCARCQVKEVCVHKIVEGPKQRDKKREEQESSTPDA